MSNNLRPWSEFMISFAPSFGLLVSSWRTKKVAHTRTNNWILSGQVHHHHMAFCSIPGANQSAFSRRWRDSIPLRCGLVRGIKLPQVSPAGMEVRAGPASHTTLLNEAYNARTVGSRDKSILIGAKVEILTIMTKLARRSHKPLSFICLCLCNRTYKVIIKETKRI